ncbi:MAG TPA: hypothetical protein VK163_01185 [Opitutaceae bacterium]|nr:hypothetical protein [Opitutaceae bacterium]
MPETFLELLAELSAHRLEVALVPARVQRHETHCVRVAVAQNPRWYRRLCAAHPSSRRRAKRAPDTRIRRRDVLALLERLAAGQATRSRYAAALSKEAARRESCPF